MKELARGDKGVKLLRSIPGLGPFFSVLVAKEIDDISRFRDEKKLCAYAGFVPSTYASGGRVFHGRITKTGNKWLRRSNRLLVAMLTSLPTISVSKRGGTLTPLR